MISHIDPHSVPLTELDAGSRHLMVERVRQHRLVRQNPPLDDGDVEIEDLHSSFEAGGKNLVAVGVRGRAV